MMTQDHWVQILSLQYKSNFASSYIAFWTLAWYKEGQKCSLGVRSGDPPEQTGGSVETDD